MTCPTCGDTGTVSRPVGVGDLMGTEPCECAKEPETFADKIAKAKEARRAGQQMRANRQPAPEHGPASEPVEDISSVKWGKARLEQYQKGIATYGVPLMTFNGLNQADLCRKALVDANNYLTALELERNYLAEIVKDYYFHHQLESPGETCGCAVCRKAKAALEGMKND